jgi:hypothetical protein
LLEPHGFSTYLVGEHDLHRLPRIRPDGRFRDWLITPKKPEELQAAGVPVRTTDS